MYVLPAIEIKGGEAVHLLDVPSQGEMRPLLDPVEVANRLQGMGAQGLHVVDVDRSIDPKVDNDQHLFNILEHTVLPVEAGGGVRSLRHIQELLDAGVTRVLVGSFGVLHRDWLKEAAVVFRNSLIACVDADANGIRINGRTEPAPGSLEAHMEAIDGFRLEAVHVSYIGSNGRGIAIMEGLAKRLKTPLTYQGPVASVQELERLEKAGVKGVILGREIYEGKLSFPDLAKRYRTI